MHHIGVFVDRLSQDSRPVFLQDPFACWTLTTLFADMLSNQGSSAVKRTSKRPGDQELWFVSWFIHPTSPNLFKELRSSTELFKERIMKTLLDLEVGTRWVKSVENSVPVYKMIASCSNHHEINTSIVWKLLATVIFRTSSPIREVKIHEQAVSQNEYSCILTIL
ncbi:hypothetical protein T265_00452 [Opisthorchis viverrini]|uniref:Uncharacterized protein n=1 Tax=Opisthorchis viverrini TaxID=6198 RepID=A0A075AJQ2_OPIVI|nr:hypothetical protein T265_00452 [Opisthorchis viverrini]KER33779.1 hypothetical protein T265_00452 [Opisthorchis viverrini]